MTTSNKEQNKNLSTFSWHFWEWRNAMWFLICFQGQHYTRSQSFCTRLGRLSGHLRLLTIILCLLSDLCFWEMCNCKASEKVQNVNLWPLLLTSTWWTRYLFPAVLFNIPNPIPVSKRKEILLHAHQQVCLGQLFCCSDLQMLDWMLPLACWDGCHRF